MVKLDLDLSEVPIGWPQGPIPEGTYRAQIVSTYLDLFQPKGLILALTWMVTEGEYLYRRIFDWVMLTGDEQVLRVSYSRLKTIASAIGHPCPESVGNSEELHDRPCFINVVTCKLEDETINEVTGYQPLDICMKPAPRNVYDQVCL